MWICIAYSHEVAIIFNTLSSQTGTCHVLVCRLMVATLVIRVITWITTHALWTSRYAKNKRQTSLKEQLTAAGPVLTLSRSVGFGECVVANVLYDRIVSPLIIHYVTDEQLSVCLSNGLRLTACHCHAFALHTTYSNTLRWLSVQHQLYILLRSICHLRQLHNHA